jgi:hypothetical protein
MVDLTLNRKTKIERIRRQGLTMVDLTLNRKTKIERIRRQGLTMVDLTLSSYSLNLCLSV